MLGKTPVGFSEEWAGSTVDVAGWGKAVMDAADLVEDLGPPTLRVAPSGEWIARFPGLGTIEVESSGAFTIHVDPASGGDDDPDRRARALRFGWAEPLSYARRGFACTSATGAVDPDRAGCLLLVGGPDRVSIAVLRLAELGWSFLGSGIIPTRWEGDELVAHPRDAPMLVAAKRAQRAEFTGTPVRLDTDAWDVALPRVVTPQPVRAVVSVQEVGRSRGGWQVLSGHERFQAATSLFVEGALSVATDPPEPEQLLASRVRLARPPLARVGVRGSTVEADLVPMLEWWSDVCVPAPTLPAAGTEEREHGG